MSVCTSRSTSLSHQSSLRVSSAVCLRSTHCEDDCKFHGIQDRPPEVADELDKLVLLRARELVVAIRLASAFSFRGRDSLANIDFEPFGRNLERVSSDRPREIHVPSSWSARQPHVSTERTRAACPVWFPHLLARRRPQVPASWTRLRQRLGEPRTLICLRMLMRVNVATDEWSLTVLLLLLLLSVCITLLWVVRVCLVLVSVNQSHPSGSRLAGDQ